MNVVAYCIASMYLLLGRITWMPKVMSGKDTSGKNLFCFIGMLSTVPALYFLVSFLMDHVSIH